MRRYIELGIAGLIAITSSHAIADARPEVPQNYPSHMEISGCSLETLSEHLQHYNVTRLELAGILRHLADDKSISPKAKNQLQGYAKNLDRMRQNLPEPNPDSDDFRNFDFQLGIALTSMTLFLNIEDENLTKRFVSERDNPESILGVYLTQLEDSRKQYMDGLSESKEQKCTG